MYNKLTRIGVSIAIVGFILNIIWENIHVQLYEGYTSFWQYLPFSFLSSFGDVLIILGIYILFVTIYSGTKWLKKLNIKNSFFIILIGILIAIIIEEFSTVLGWWVYNSNMPMIPLFDIGLSPVLQMAILPFVTFKIVEISKLK